MSSPVWCAESSALLESLRSGTVDLALVGIAGVPPEDIATQVVLEDRLAVLVPAVDRWSGKSKVSLRDLGTRPVITLPRGTGMRDALDAAVDQCGVDVRVAGEVSSVSTATVMQ